jgi:hypothetical protein
VAPIVSEQHFSFSSATASGKRPTIDATLSLLLFPAEVPHVCTAVYHPSDAPRSATGNSNHSKSVFGMGADREPEASSAGPSIRHLLCSFVHI